MYISQIIFMYFALFQNKKERNRRQRASFGKSDIFLHTVLRNFKKL